MEDAPARPHHIPAFWRWAEDCREQIARARRLLQETAPLVNPVTVLSARADALTPPAPARTGQDPAPGTAGDPALQPESGCGPSLTQA
jgi:hypothetical protein